ncbi:unnamed protein product [Arabis nemorensis]|uniref:non-specific serine/threonine protein kinase n=1 Tax=Arabis nemorensis TaxID=586526 RepID=A0A565BEI7_9BRAS|nr:unnamed protein product [Arabis nemorensis]
MARYNLCLQISFASFFAVLVLLVRAQDQSGFVSIDCGIPDDSSYNDETTDIKYISDAAFVESGTIHSIDPKFQTSSLDKQFQSVRSFPEGKRNCYDVQPPQGKGFKYLIRTRFMYGNYDNLGKAPEFDLYLGVNLWDSVTIDNATTIVTKEIIHTLRSDHVHVCLVDKDRGIPFLSVLELRLLKSDTYETPYDSMMLFKRWDLGGLGNLPIRYKDDVFDRIWIPLRFPKYKIFNASLTIDSNNNNGFQPARSVMNTATSPEDLSQDIILYWEPLDPTWKYYVYMHFAEVVELPSNETREFTVLLNKKSINMSVFSPRYLYTDTLFVQNPVSGPKLEFLLKRTAKSTLPPIINAIETYRVNEFLQSPTDQQDVHSIMMIKSNYRVKKNWLGDPCAPGRYPWKDINCSYVGNEPPRIVSVNLSLSGLAGEIDPTFSNLTSIQKLDLSNNNLTGKVPNFLGNLHNLTELNLEGNKLTGALPAKLLERSRSGLLSLRFDGNPDLCVSASCQNPDLKTKKSVYIIPVVVSVAGVLGLVLAITLFLLYKKRHQSGGSHSVRTGPLDTTKRYYKYSKVVKVTNNFERILGQGGFGIVYHGVLNDDQVAVKILSESSAQGYKEFRAEVELLLRVHHKNLTALIGYCNEGKKMALIYEFMANGTLGDYLSGKKSYVLSWEERLQISLDAAQGLEYLHNGCKPPIVQRDVKPANILIDEKLQAKIADFGLSRSVALDGNNQDTTAVAGTIGYLDPEYQSTQKLSEKSDVYSFGVVLLEVVTGQPVIARSRTTAENIHITDWVESLLSTGDIRGIVDPKLGERFDAGSAWKITEVAMACASSSSKHRPTMSQVVAELKESVSRAIGAGGYSGASSSFTTEPAMSASDSGMFPQASESEAYPLSHIDYIIGRRLEAAVSVRKLTPLPWLFYPLDQLSATGRFPELKNHRIFYSRDGWLLVRDYYYPSGFFLNPFTRERIKLPSGLGYYLAFSVAPTSTSCVVISLKQLCDKSSIVIDTWRPGENVWTKHCFENPLTECKWTLCVFSNGMFYWLSAYGYLGVFNPSRETWNILPVKPCPADFARPVLMTEHEGDIYVMYTSNRSDQPVFKLNLENKIWEEKRDFGGLTVFSSYPASLTRAGLSAEERDIIYERLSLHYSFSNDKSFFCPPILSRTIAWMDPPHNLNF